MAGSHQERRKKDESPVQALSQTWLEASNASNGRLKAASPGPGQGSPGWSSLLKPRKRERERGRGTKRETEKESGTEGEIARE